MLYLVRVIFLPDCSISPEEFAHRINARWTWSESGTAGDFQSQSGGSAAPREVLCIADIDSIEQFAIDVSIMPGGISNIEVESLPELVENLPAGYPLRTLK